MDMEWIHDMRLFLQLIQSSAQMLELTAGGAAERGYVEALLEGAGQMRRLLDDALSGQPRRGDRPVEVVGWLRALCMRCQACAGQRGVVLRFSSNVDALPMATDADRLDRVALNLIMNALRFSPPKGVVDVRCAALGDFMELSVTDRGRGIDPERLPFLFLWGETDGGHGYGLPSAMEGARLLGGDLSATSAPGQGSTFTLRLPVRGAMVS